MAKPKHAEVAKQYGWKDENNHKSYENEHFIVYAIDSGWIGLNKDINKRFIVGSHSVSKTLKRLAEYK